MLNANKYCLLLGELLATLNFFSSKETIQKKLVLKLDHERCGCKNMFTAGKLVEKKFLDESIHISQQVPLMFSSPIVVAFFRELYLYLQVFKKKLDQIINMMKFICLIILNRFDHFTNRLNCYSDRIQVSCVY